MAESNQPDRGAHRYLNFHKADRGFTLYTGASNHTYAFDRIEDLAAWLVAEYGEEKHSGVRFEHGLKPQDFRLPTPPTETIYTGGTINPREHLRRGIATAPQCEPRYAEEDGG